MASHDDEAVKLARERLSRLPPATLSSKLLELHDVIEQQIARGRRIQAVVDDLNAAGIAVSLAVFKSTLYRLRKKKQGKMTRTTARGGAALLRTPAPQAAVSTSTARPPRYQPPTEETFK